MLNIGGWELLIILLVALVFLGPERLPGAARQLGQTVSQLRAIAQGFQQELESATQVAKNELPSTTASTDNPSSRTGATPRNDAAAADGASSEREAVADGANSEREAVADTAGLDGAEEANTNAADTNAVGTNAEDANTDTTKPQEAPTDPEAIRRAVSESDPFAKHVVRERSAGGPQAIPANGAASDHSGDARVAEDPDANNPARHYRDDDFPSTDSRAVDGQVEDAE